MYQVKLCRGQPRKVRDLEGQDQPQRLDVKKKYFFLYVRQAFKGKAPPNLLQSAIPYFVISKFSEKMISFLCEQTKNHLNNLKKQIIVSIQYLELARRFCSIKTRFCGETRRELTPSKQHKTSLGPLLTSSDRGH